jgi:hypothetical protein
VRDHARFGQSGTRAVRRLAEAGAAGAALEARYALDNARTGTVALGFSYDSCAWFLTGEAASMTSHSFLGHRSAAYLSGGLRFGDWTPYLAYAIAQPVSPIADPGLPLSGLDGTRLARSSRLNSGLNYSLSSIPHQHSLTAGVRGCGAQLCAENAVRATDAGERHARHPDSCPARLPCRSRDQRVQRCAGLRVLMGAHMSRYWQQCCALV